MQRRGASFNRWKSFILILEGFVKLVPARLALWMWGWSEYWPGTLGVGVRYLLLRRIARSCGTNVVVARGVEIRSVTRLSLGSNVSIQRNSYIDAVGGIDIGSDVSIAHQCSIISFEHGWENEELPIRQNPSRYMPIVIGNDVWLGCGARILAGVSIGNRCVVGAGSVVTKDVQSYSLVGGVPAKMIRNISTLRSESR